MLLRTFTATPKLQFNISDPRGKIVQNVTFWPISKKNKTKKQKNKKKNSDLTLKLNLTRQHESIDMLDFQNRAPNIKLLKFHRNRDNRAYLEKHKF